LKKELWKLIQLRKSLRQLAGDLEGLHIKQAIQVCLLPVLPHKGKGRWQTGIEASVSVPLTTACPNNPAGIN
jgi:hypothetical protein